MTRHFKFGGGLGAFSCHGTIQSSDLSSVGDGKILVRDDGFIVKAEGNGNVGEIHADADADAALTTLDDPKLRIA